jgi:hypothetical protein
MVSKNAVQHHEKFRELAESSRTCGLCALLLACVKEAPQDILLRLLREERESALIRNDDNEDNDGLVSLKPEVYEMVEECYGSGKLLSELRVTIRASILGRPSNTYHVDDDIIRVYAE